MTTQSITSGQIKQYKRFVEDAADKALVEVGLDKDGLQKLIKNGDEFQTRIIAGIRELSVSNQFADEEVEPSDGYLSAMPMKSSLSSRFPPTPKDGSLFRSGSRSPRPTTRRLRK